MCCLLTYKSQTTLGMLQSSIRHIFRVQVCLKRKKIQSYRRWRFSRDTIIKTYQEVRAIQSLRRVWGPINNPKASVTAGPPPVCTLLRWLFPPSPVNHITFPSCPSSPLAPSSLLSYPFFLIFQLSLPMIHFITRVACLTTLRTQSHGSRALQLWATLCVSRHRYCKKVVRFGFLPAFFPRL